MNSDETARKSWQATVTEPQLPSLDQVRIGANKFYRWLRIRNFTEYVSCVIVVVCFGIYSFTLEHVLQRIGSVMIVAATFVVAWQLRRRASAIPPESAGEMPILDFARAQMVRQHEALTSVFWWYLLPFIPGMAVFMGGTFLLRPPQTTGQVIGSIVAVGIVCGIFAGVWWLNQHWARKLQRHIDDIDALRG